jgi:drug/metabolite transporter (DMT)-like permease
MADPGVFTPAMLAFFVALFTWIGLGAAPRGSRALGPGLILAGALAIGRWEALARGGAWRGHLLFLCATASWAVCTLAHGRSALGALHSAALMCFWSRVAIVPAALILGTDFLRGGWGALLGLLLPQGVLSGFLATITDFFAITRLGPQRLAAFAALVPGLAALGGLAFPGEALRPVEMAGLGVVMLGGALAAGALAPMPRR